MPRWDGKLFARGVMIGAMVCACAILSMIVALAVLQLQLSEDDAGREGGTILSEPFVFPFAVQLAFVTGLIGYPFAFFLLVRTQLKWSLPVVLVATVAGTAIGAVVHPILVAPVLGLLVGIAAMIWCRLNLREASARANPS